MINRKGGKFLDMVFMGGFNGQIFLSECLDKIQLCYLGKSFEDKEMSNCKGFEVELCLFSLKISKEFSELEQQE